MKFLMICLMGGLMLSVQGNTAEQSTVSGQVRLADGQPVAGAQVTLFDLAGLQRGAVARATTDESGYFALPLASLGGSALPQGFTLGQNYPNPFNPSTVIPYQLPTATHVRIDVFNVLGQQVATLVDAERQAGFHAAKWDATDAAGQAMAAGVYLYRLTVGGGQQIKRMVLIDGQAGIAAEASSTAATMAVPTDAAEREYGLVVSGEGLTTYADAAFGVRVGMAAVELVVDAAPLTRDKVLAGEILGDVNNDGQVVLEDALLVAMYSSNPSIAMPNNGSILLGDINGDGAVNETDGLLIMRYISNPLDGALPAGIGQRIASGKRSSDSPQYRYETPAWSPDGSRIAFSSDSDIYVMDADGSKVRNLTNDGNPLYRTPAWSPDGRQIAFSSDSDIYVMNADGSGMRQLTDHKDIDRTPAWSSDGSRIAFSSNRHGKFGIYVMNADGPRQEQKLTDGSSPAWSPDGSRIAFSSDSDIYVMNMDGSGPAQKLTDHEAVDRTPAWSPDGSRITFSSNRDGNFDIYVMNANGSGPAQRLTDHKDVDKQPTWSSDGKIAFSSNRRHGNFDIYVMNADGSDVRKLTSETTGEGDAPETTGEGDAPETTDTGDDEGDGSETTGEGDDPETTDEGDDAETTDEEDSSETTGEEDDAEATDEGDDAETTDEGDDAGDAPETTDTGDERTFSLLLGDASMEFVWIEPGVFQMGSDTGRTDERPVHEVEISRGFWLGKYEITQEQWKAVMDNEPWSGRDRVESNPSHPAVIISWDEVQEFIGRLNAEAGEELYRLPTEAEWEYACRAGTQTRWSFGDDESLLTEHAWYHGNNYPTEGAKAVGDKLPNPWGLYDMHGNVWEWVQDWYDEEYYNRLERDDPQGPTSGLGRVIRGGHFGHIDGVRSAYRHFHSPDSRSYTIGVRLLRILGD